MKKLTAKRILEIIPGLTMWIALIAPFVLSFTYPTAVGIFIILFDLYWIYKALITGYHLVVGFLHMRKYMRMPWKKKLEAVQPSAIIADPAFVYNAVILATYKEEMDILRPSVESIVKSDFAHERIIFVLATEERDKQRAHTNAAILKKEFGSAFYDFIVTEHPDGIKGEMKAKGANVTWAAKKLSDYVNQKGIDPEMVIVSTADADSRFHPHYFSALTYEFVTNPNRQRRSFQPIPVFANNIWEAPAIARLLAYGSTFWQLVESTRPWRLMNFSTHAMSLALLQAIDYWDVTVVNEDSCQFWRAYYTYQGDHEVVPIFFPVYMDAVLADTFWLTMQNQYRQRLRWAYGVEHFPHVVLDAWKHTEISLIDRIVKVWRLYEANFSWATASIFIAFVGWFPILVNRTFAHTVLAYNIPLYTTRLMAITWVGLIISAYITIQLLPPRPSHFRRRHELMMALQWFLVPIGAIFFGSIPSIHAQTRLMFGKYMGFWTTQKSTAIKNR